MPDSLIPSLPPTADLPPGATRGPQHPPVHGACPRCGVLVLAGRTPQGQTVLVEPGVPTYVVQWDPGAPQPMLYASRGYPVHRCTS